MSTDIAVNGNFDLVRYFGGKDRGICFQITMMNGKYIWLKQDDAKELARAILENLLESRTPESAG